MVTLDNYVIEQWFYSYSKKNETVSRQATARTYLVFSQPM